MCSEEKCTCTFLATVIHEKLTIFGSQLSKLQWFFSSKSIRIHLSLKILSHPYSYAQHIYAGKRLLMAEIREICVLMQWAVNEWSLSGVNIRFLYGDYADSPVQLVEIVETLSSSLKGEFLRRFSTVMHKSMLFQMCFKKNEICWLENTGIKCENLLHKKCSRCSIHSSGPYPTIWQGQVKKGRF